VLIAQLPPDSHCAMASQFTSADAVGARNKDAAIVAVAMMIFRIRSNYTHTTTGNPPSAARGACRYSVIGNDPKMHL